MGKPIKGKRTFEIAYYYGIHSSDITKYLATKNINVSNFSILDDNLMSIIQERFGKLPELPKGRHKEKQINEVAPPYGIKYEDIHGQEDFQNNSNELFIYLRKDYDELYQLCLGVVQNIDCEKSLCMLKARQAVEFIVAYLGAKTKDLYESINYLESNSIAPSHIIKSLHFIRKNANKSVHNDADADTEGILSALAGICIWLVVEHDKKFR